MTTRFRLMSTAFIVVSASGLAGCLGTGTSRIPSYNHPDESWFGSYPYRAVVDDVEIVAWSGGSIPDSPALGSIGVLAGIVSIPFDIVVDTVLLPVDTVGWICGKKKGRGRLIPRVGP